MADLSEKPRCQRKAVRSIVGLSLLGIHRKEAS